MRSLLGVILALSLSVAGSTPAAADTFKLSVAQDGVYRVFFEDLESAGLAAAYLDSASLGLTVAGEAVAIWLEDGGDGQFGPGDWFEFIGESPRGEVSYHHEYAGLNVYWLQDDTLQPARMSPAEPVGDSAVDGSQGRFRRHLHLEQDRLLLRFSRRSQDGEDLWYWTKLSHIDRKPFGHDLPLAGLDTTSDEPVTLRVGLRGWSKPRHKVDESLADHLVEVLVNDRLVGQVAWEAQDSTVFAVDLPAAGLMVGDNRLELRIPARIPPGATDPLIDLVVLDWLEWTYPHDGVVADRQVRLEVSAEAAASLRLGVPADELVIYGSEGTRILVPKGSLAPVPAVAVPAAQAGEWIMAVAGEQWLSVESIELDQRTDLATNSRRADYIIITHPRLHAAIEPLAEFHRQRGLEVLVTDIRDVYDEFNHGVMHPRAIRDFLRHAYHEWRPPAPRFVLLVGDASWDTKNPRVKKKNYAGWSYREDFGFGLQPTRGTPYAEDADVNHRNLIPTWNHLTVQGHAASDNWFVAVDGDDILPDMAIGRLPVTEPAEVTAIVDKTLRYIASPEVGPWRRRVVWISDGAEQYDRISDEVSREIGIRGFAGVDVRPTADDPNNERQRARLMEAFDHGGLLVHFVGHGGRFIWRTAPADFKNNRDLFRLEDLDGLASHPRLPVIVSMTCYSAPFDHPNSDSIGEKFLRLPDRGAVGVIAASWRIVPGLETSRLMMTRLTEAGTVGEALQRAKRESNVQHFIHLFNLLGDPALPISVPPLDVTLELAAADPPRVAAELGEVLFAGQAIFDWLSDTGEVLESETVAIGEPRFSGAFGGDPATAAFVRVYVWNEELGVDGVGSLRLPGAAKMPSGDSEQSRR